jgi:anti-sigma regulatory factor (Ser/Thr protein kinase)
LVANATRHARDRLGTNLRLVVSRDGERLRIEVHDSNPALPRIRHGGLLEENGQGLLLAETLADRLGWQVPARGKAVYVELIAWPPTARPH